LLLRYAAVVKSDCLLLEILEKVRTGWSKLERGTNLWWKKLWAINHLHSSLQNTW